MNRSDIPPAAPVPTNPPATPEEKKSPKPAPTPQGHEQGTPGNPAGREQR